MVEAHQSVRENLSNINSQIRDLAGGRHQSQLSVLEQEHLAQLHCEKDHGLVQALQLRQSGDEMIKLAVLGRLKKIFTHLQETQSLLAFCIIQEMAETTTSVDT